MGGGGIQPDLIVPPAQFTRLEAVLDESGALTSYATQYLATHSPLPASFKITPEMMDDIKVFLAARRIQPSVAEWSTERPWISARLMEEIVTQARGVAQGDELQAQRDPQVQAALKAMQEGRLLAAR